MEFLEPWSGGECGGGNGRGRRHRGGGGCAMPIPAQFGASLSPEAHSAVLEALDDEYRARAFYLAVLERFPGAMPFLHIVDAELRHADALGSVLSAYGNAVPANRHIGSEDIRRSVPTSAACARDLAASEERRNVSLYERLLAQVADYPPIAEVFTRLMLASRDRHLPAFERGSTGLRQGGGFSRSYRSS